MRERAEQGKSNINRREFIATTAAAGLLLSGGPRLFGVQDKTKESTVLMVKGASRAELVPKLLDMFGRDRWGATIAGKKVILKPNLNSPHEFPGTSHPETMRLLLGEIRNAGSGTITVTDRGGMGVTSQIAQKLGIDKIPGEFGAEFIPFDALSSEDIVHKDLPGSHWERGVEMPKLYDEADCIINTCCLKTHQYGGHFTLSLKNAVGMVARMSAAGNYDYMRALHSGPNQRVMIAELNQLYSPAFILLDGLVCFVDGGPHAGTAREPGILLAGTDRVAIDAVGVAILRHFGTTPEVSQGKIFELDQIKRAVELGLGAAGPEQIEIVTDGGGSEEFAKTIRGVLELG
jgi:uncharacterized protein (DUF362 family)